jgi:hypothetical protein
MNPQSQVVVITATFAGLSWVEQIDLILRWGAATAAIVVGVITIYQRLRK